jgi:hypothetical protein
MSMKTLPKIVAAGATALLLLAGCGGSFIPGTVAQNDAATGTMGSQHASTLAAPGSIGAHPTTESAQTPAPTASPDRDADQAVKSKPGHRSKLSIGPHPAHGEDDNSGDDPSPSPSPSASS